MREIFIGIFIVLPLFVVLPGFAIYVGGGYLFGIFDALPPGLHRLHDAGVLIMLIAALATLRLDRAPVKEFVHLILASALTALAAVQSQPVYYVLAVAALLGVFWVMAARAIIWLFERRAGRPTLDLPSAFPYGPAAIRDELDPPAARHSRADEDWRAQTQSAILRLLQDAGELNAPEITERLSDATIAKVRPLVDEMTAGGLLVARATDFGKRYALGAARPARSTGDEKKDQA